MNGREFSVKCPMATGLLLEKRDTPDAQLARVTEERDRLQERLDMSSRDFARLAGECQRGLEERDRYREALAFVSSANVGGYDGEFSFEETCNYMRRTARAVLTTPEPPAPPSSEITEFLGVKFLGPDVPFLCFALKDGGRVSIPPDQVKRLWNAAPSSEGGELR